MAIPRRAVPTPGSITARCTVPRGKNGAAASSASAPSTTSCRATSWVTSTSCTARPAVRAIPRIAPFISATHGSRTPKSVVSVTMASNPFDRRPSAVPIHDEIRHERERPLALAQVRADGLPEAVLVRHKVERVVRDLERDSDVEAVAGERLDLAGREAAEQRANPAARGHERGRLLRDDAEVIGLRREAAPLALELDDLGFRHGHRGPRERLH